MENLWTLSFYRLQKINKIFDSFPELRPITFGFDSCKPNLSKFVDSFLNFQAQKCKSYIRGTKDFTINLSDYYFKKIESKNKSIPFVVIKNLIFMILKSNSFRFGNENYRQHQWYQIMLTYSWTILSRTYSVIIAWLKENFKSVDSGAKNVPFTSFWTC